MMMTKPAVLDMPSACAFVSLSESVLQQLVRELEAWAEARPFSDLPPPPNTQRKGVGA